MFKKSGRSIEKKRNRTSYQIRKRLILATTSVAGVVLLFSVMSQDSLSLVLETVWSYSISILIAFTILILAYQKYLPAFLRSHQTEEVMHSITDRIEDLEHHLRNAHRKNSHINKAELHDELGDLYRELWDTIKEEPLKSAHCFRKSVKHYEKSLTGCKPESTMPATIHLKLGKIINSYLGSSSGITNISDTLINEALKNLCKAVDGSRKNKLTSLAAEASHQLGILYERFFLLKGDKDYLNLAYAAFEQAHDYLYSSKENELNELHVRAQTLYRSNLLLMAGMAVIRSRYIDNSEDLEQSLSLCQEYVNSIEQSGAESEVDQFSTLIMQLEKLTEPEREVVMTDLKRLISSL